MILTTSTDDNPVVSSTDGDSSSLQETSPNTNDDDGEGGDSVSEESLHDDDDDKGPQNDRAGDPIGGKSDDGSVSDASSGEGSTSTEEDPLEAARQARERLLARTQNKERREEPDNTEPERHRNIDLLSMKKRNSKSDLFEGEGEEESVEGSKDGDTEPKTDDDTSKAAQELEASNSSKNDDTVDVGSDAESPAPPSVDTDDAVRETKTDGAENENTANDSQDQLLEQSDSAYTVTDEDVTHEASSSENSRTENNEVQEPPNAEPGRRTEDNVEETGKGDGTADASSAIETEDDKDGPTLSAKHEQQDKQSKSKKPKDSSKKSKAKKKEKTKDKKSKSKKTSTTKKSKAKGKSSSSLAHVKRPSVGMPLETLDEQSVHDPSQNDSQDPKHTQTSLSLLLNSIEQTHLGMVSKSNQTVGEYSAGSFISDTGWSDGTSSSYDSDEDDESSSGSFNPDHRIEEHHDDFMKKTTSETPITAEYQDEEVPPEKEDEPFPKSGTTPIIKRLFAKKKYDSLDENAVATPTEAPKSSPAAATNQRKSFNIVANLFRPKKQPNQQVTELDEIADGGDPTFSDGNLESDGIEFDSSRPEDKTVGHHGEGETTGAGSNEVVLLLSEERVDIVMSGGIATAGVGKSEEDVLPRKEEGKNGGKSSPSNPEATSTTNNPRKPFSIVASLFRPRKQQKQDVPKSPEASTELEGNNKEEGNEMTNDSPQVDGADNQGTPKLDNPVTEEILESAEPEGNVSHNEDATRNLEEGETSAGPEAAAVVDKTAANEDIAPASVELDDGNLEGDSEHDDHPEGTEVPKDKHKTQSKKKDGQSNKKKKDQSDSAAGDDIGRSRKKEKDGDTKKRSKSATNSKKKKKATDSKEKDSSAPAQDAKSVAKKKTKKPASSHVASEESDVVPPEEDKPTKAKTKRKSQAADSE